MTFALIGFAAILVLAFMRMPLGVALGLIGVVGFSELSNYRAGMSNAARLVIDSGQSYGLSVVPLFILMGLMVDRGGMAKELYRAAYTFLGHRRGGLAMSTSGLSTQTRTRVRMARRQWSWPWLSMRGRRCERLANLM